jgi:hypothetical protein
MAVAAVLLSVVGALSFVMDEIPGLKAGDIYSLSGDTERNFRQSDLDGDGVVDLILPGGVAFQRSGRFPEEAWNSFPESIQSPLCDVWGRSLYLFYENRLDIVEWRNSAFDTIHSQAISYPPPSAETSFSESAVPGEGGPLRFQRMLHDFDGDGTPEIVFPSTEGLLVHGRTDGDYAEASILAVFPDPKPLVEATTSLWSDTGRRLVAPQRQMACLFFLDGAKVVTIERMPGLKADELIFRVEESLVDVKKSFALAPNSVMQWDTPSLPGWLRPCDLNGDGSPDFAGGRQLMSEASMAPVPLYETQVSLDGGETRQTFRGAYVQPRCAVVDMNGDGMADVVTQDTQLFSGDTREALSRALTSRDMDLWINVHAQEEDGKFEERASIRGHVEIRLDEPPLRRSRMLEMYLQGGLVNVTGDINGDGLRDLLIHDRARRLTVLLNTGAGFNSRAAATIALDGPTRYGVLDVNGDGLSDVILRDPIMRDGREPRSITPEATKVFLAQESSL